MVTAGTAFRRVVTDLDQLRDGYTQRYRDDAMRAVERMRADLLVISAAADATESPVTVDGLTDAINTALDGIWEELAGVVL
jgi:hypothetical protein